MMLSVAQRLLSVLTLVKLMIQCAVHLLSRFHFNRRFFAGPALDKPWPNLPVAARSGHSIEEWKLILFNLSCLCLTL